jgi:uncharacterized membrane protein
MDKKIISTTVAAIVALGVSMAATGPVQAAKATGEKCYGIAKKGHNDCATSQHACAGMATTNNNPQEWKFVPTGTCVKMGGTLAPGGASTDSATQK